MRHAVVQAVKGPASQSARAAIPGKLLRWYDLHKRDLPWRRRTDDPYAQWVAEIMLQQTRVETVLTYYERFLQQFPTIRRLAEADHEVVLKKWEGLGYYRRVLHLHRAARMVRDNGGVIPDSAESLRALPGVGEYTAAAIASIAFDRPEAAVDGNVARVLSRLFGVTEDVRSPDGKSRIRKLARSLLMPRRPGDFNQAWMDLGSMVCTPKAPRCDVCPLRRHCAAARSGEPEAYPRRDGARKRPKDVLLVTAIFCCKGRFLVRRREQGGLWSGLWEFPTAEYTSDPVAGVMGTRHVRRLAGEMGVLITERPRRVAEVRHQLTHRSLCFHVYATSAEAVNGTIPANSRWVNVRAFQKLPISTAHRRIFEAGEQAGKFKVENCKRGRRPRAKPYEGSLH